MGVTTVNWAYSGNAFRFAKNRPGYRDLGLLRSIAVAERLWVWNAEFRDWLEARRTGEPRTVEIIGPAMAGDSRWLALSPAAARERYGIGSVPGARYLALFDVATLNQNHRRLYGFGPTTAPIEMLSQLYLDARRLLEEHPDWRLILKPKRSYDESTREYPDSLRDLLNSPLKDRILLLDHRIDPHIPIAIAEASIGNPFVSPVLAALHAGRRGLFHDPLAQVMDFHPTGYRQLVTHSYAELKARLNQPQEQAAGPAPADPGQTIADRIHSLLHDG
jgi:polysaccharide biosynthesis PFTS motif protein